MLDQPLAAVCLWLKQSHLYMKQQLKAAKTCAKLNTLEICSFIKPKASQNK